MESLYNLLQLESLDDGFKFKTKTFTEKQLVDLCVASNMVTESLMEMTPDVETLLERLGFSLSAIYILILEGQKLARKAPKLYSSYTFSVDDQQRIHQLAVDSKEEGPKLRFSVDELLTHIWHFQMALWFRDKINGSLGLPATAKIDPAVYMEVLADIADTGEFEETRCEFMLCLSSGAGKIDVVRLSVGE